MKCPISYINCDSLCKMPQAVLLVMLATIAGLATVYIAQFGYGFMPCELCLWQRMPYWASLVLCVVILGAGRNAMTPVLILLLVLAWLTSAGLGLYHAGVEQHWWIHGGACGGAGQALTAESLLNTPIQRCDEIGWTFLGLSMATWNVPFSLALAAFMGMTYVKNYR